MLVNHFKFRQDVQSYHLGGMGCGNGVMALSLLRDLLQVWLAEGGGEKGQRGRRDAARGHPPSERRGAAKRACGADGPRAQQCWWRAKDKVVQRRPHRPW